MPYFIVIVSGSEIKIPSVPEPAIGFFAARNVKAADSKSAVQIAKDLVMKEWREDGYANGNIGQPLVLEIEEVKQISILSRLLYRIPNKGFTFYSQE